MFLLISVMVFILGGSTYPLNGKDPVKYSLKLPAQSVHKSLNAEDTREKRARLFWLKEHMQKLGDKCASAFKSTDSGTSGLKGVVELLPETFNIQELSDGYFYITGICENKTEPQAVLIYVTARYYDSNHTLLETTIDWVFGGTNILVEGDENSLMSINALHPGEKGFFMAQSAVAKYGVAVEIDFSLNYAVREGGPLLFANAHLAISDIDYSTWRNHYVKARATVTNSSATHATAMTFVIVALFDTANTRLVEGDLAMPGSPSAPGYNWAIYPNGTETVDLYYQHAQTGQVGTEILSSFIFYEYELNNANELAAPFGSFDTPQSGSAVSGSIPVTGWALDDVNLKSLKIYRKEGTSLQYIGDANFIDDARPDVAAAYPDYPNCTKAGWGYMLLTHFLPDGGNGTYTLVAIATDWKGKSTTLGEKTFTCDNAHAVKPFGAIDTPEQGGTAWGNKFINWGWALTPPGDYLKIDGTTIYAYVDGVKLPGHVTYNKPRGDLETYFSSGGYLNLQNGMPGALGAAGYYIIDTSAYPDGVHTIQWTAKDSGGDTDGIGSRYFIIINDLFNILENSYERSSLTANEIETLPRNDHDAIYIFNGYSDEIEAAGTMNTRARTRLAENGVYTVDIKEMERLRITLTGNNTLIAGNHLVNGQLHKLPAGTTLDTNKGMFSWQPGPGFLGKYHLVFIEKDAAGQTYRKDIIVNIK